MKESLIQAWYGGRRYWWLWLLYPLAWLYLGIVTYRRHRFLIGWRSRSPVEIPVIIVGNLTVGGTGKTPLTLHLVKLLRAAGWRPGIVSRGYGGKTSYPSQVGPLSTAAEVGDEPLLMFRESGAPVVVDPQRRRGVDYMARHALCDIVLSDDGLQHYALPRDLELVVIDASRGLGNGRTLPLGPLREPLARLASVDAVLINGEPEACLPHEIPDHVPCFRFQLAPGALQPMGGQDPQGAPGLGARVHAVAGIGHPQRFFRTLECMGFQVIPHPYADHHAYVAADLDFGDDIPVIMTSKDAVKCRDFANPSTWVLPVSVVTDTGFDTFIMAFLSRCREKHNHAG